MGADRIGKQAPAPAPAPPATPAAAPQLAPAADVPPVPAADQAAAQSPPAGAIPAVDDGLRRTLLLPGDTFAQRAPGGANAGVATPPDKPTLYLRLGAEAYSAQTYGQYRDLATAAQGQDAQAGWQAAEPFAARTPAATARAGVALGFDSKHFGVELSLPGSVAGRVEGVGANFADARALHGQYQDLSAQVQALNAESQALQARVASPEFQSQLASLRADMATMNDASTSDEQKAQAAARAYNTYQGIRPTLRDAAGLMERARGMMQPLDLMARTLGDGTRTGSAEVVAGATPQLKLKGRVPLPDAGPFTRLSVGASVKGIYVPPNPQHDPSRPAIEQFPYLLGKATATLRLVTQGSGEFRDLLRDLDRSFGQMADSARRVDQAGSDSSKWNDPEFRRDMQRSLDDIERAGNNIDADLRRLQDSGQMRVEYEIRKVMPTSPFGLGLDEIGIRGTLFEKQWVDLDLGLYARDLVGYLPGVEQTYTAATDARDSSSWRAPEFTMTGQKERNVYSDFFPPRVGMGMNLNLKYSRRFPTTFVGVAEHTVSASGTTALYAGVQQHFGQRVQIGAGVIQMDLRDPVPLMYAGNLSVYGVTVQAAADSVAAEGVSKVSGTLGYKTEF